MLWPGTQPKSGTLRLIIAVTKGSSLPRLVTGSPGAGNQLNRPAQGLSK
jgi:hypothetical protein